MRKKLFMWMCALLFASVATACAPGLGRTIRTNRIPPMTLDSQTKQKLSELKCRFGSFVDARSQSAVGEIDGRKLEPAEDVGTSIKLALESELRDAGASVSLFEGPVLTGEVLEWEVKVKPGFPTSFIDANATIRLQVHTPDEKAVYSARYSGSFSEKHPLANEDRVESALAGAMAFALTEALQDQGLTEELRHQGQPKLKNEVR